MACGCASHATQPLGSSLHAPAAAQPSPSSASGTVEWIHLPITGLSAPTKAHAGSVRSARERGFAIDELSVGSTTVLVWTELDLDAESAKMIFEERALDADTAQVNLLDDGVVGVYGLGGSTTVAVFRLIEGQPIYCEGTPSVQTSRDRARDEHRILEVCQSLRSDGAPTAEYWLKPLGLVIVAPKGAELTDYPMETGNGEDSCTLEMPGFALSIRRRQPRRNAADAPDYDGHRVTKIDEGFEFTVESATPPKFSGYYDVGDDQFICVLQRIEASTELSDVREICRSLRPDGTAEGLGDAHGRGSGIRRR